MKKDRVKIARKYKREIAKLQRERDKLYNQALRKLNLEDTGATCDYFMNDHCGYSSFEEWLRENS